MRGSLSWLSGVIDNAIYPVLFAGACVTMGASKSLPFVCTNTTHRPPNPSTPSPENPAACTHTQPYAAPLSTYQPPPPPQNTDYVASLDERLAEPLNRTLLILAFALTLSYLAWRGLDVAGKLAIGICIGCLLPFAALCVAGAFDLDLGRARAWRGDVDGVSMLLSAVCVPCVGAGKRRA